MTDNATPRQPRDDDPIAFDFPAPPVPLKTPRSADSITWAQYMDEIAWLLERYLRHHDDPGDRLAHKLKERFVL